MILSTSYGCPGGPENSDDTRCTLYPATNVLALEGTGQRYDFWLSENFKKGTDQRFVVSLGCSKTVKGVTLRNTNNGGVGDRSTKHFRILGSNNENGPWEELLEESLEDTRRENPQPVLEFTFANPASVEFIQFQMLDFWGIGGGLQYLSIISSTTSSSATTTTTTTTTITTKTTTTTPVGGDELI